MSFSTQLTLTQSSIKVKGKEVDVFHATFKKLLEDIIEALKTQYGIEVNESFAVLVVKVVSLDPECKFLIKQPIIRSEIDRMKKVVIERIHAMSEIARNILRMQLHYNSRYFTRQELVDAHNLAIENIIKEILTDLKTTVPKHQRHFDVYYQKLISVTIMKSGMGASNEYTVAKLTEDALASIFPKDDINLLQTMTIKERENELRHLMKMTTGIRLYNKATNPEEMGVGIPNLIDVLPDRLTASLELVNEMKHRNIQRLISYTSLIKPYFLNPPHVSKNGRRTVSEQMVYIRQGLVMVHQLLIYLKDLTEELYSEQSISSDIINHHQNCLQDLKTTFEQNKSVATFIIYPKFVELANSWQRIQESVAHAESCGELVECLQTYSESELSILDPIVAEHLKLAEITVPSEDQFFTFEEAQMTDDQYALARRISFTFDLDPLETQYSGFCIWSLVKGIGLVLLSNPNLGVFNWKGNEYLLSCPEACLEFRRDPDSFIYKVVQIVRKWPELIFLLNMDLEAFNPDYVTEADRHLTTSTLNTLISKEAEIQTELHPLESNIVPGYSWNEWEFRRRGIILSKIHKCTTHSTQTHWQALKKTENIQTYPLKNRRQQTDTNISAEAPRNQFWFHGLRGCQKHPPHIVNLTREPVDDMKVKWSTQVEVPEELPD